MVQKSSEYIMSEIFKTAYRRVLLRNIKFKVKDGIIYFKCVETNQWYDSFLFNSIINKRYDIE